MRVLEIFKVWSAGPMNDHVHIAAVVGGARAPRRADGVVDLLRALPGFDLSWFSPDDNFVMVSAITACALFVAAVVVVSAMHTREAGVVWLGLGCSFVGLFVIGHTA